MADNRAAKIGMDFLFFWYATDMRTNESLWFDVFFFAFAKSIRREYIA